MMLSGANIATLLDQEDAADPLVIAPTVASLFDFSVPMNDGALDALAAGLEDKEALLILDNCEHLIAGVARLTSALLRRAPWISQRQVDLEDVVIAFENGAIRRHIQPANQVLKPIKLGRHPRRTDNAYQGPVVEALQERFMVELQAADPR